MATEVEVKILDVDPAAIKAGMEMIGAEKLFEERLMVDWYRPGTWNMPAEEMPWYLRIRSHSSSGKVEITWKDKPRSQDGARVHEEITLMVDNDRKAGEFLEAIGMVRRAHQEKDRTMWRLKDWTFCLDTYPLMPSWLEIEGRDGAHIRAAVVMLGLDDHTSTVEGERVVIKNEYGLDWYDMRF